MNYPLLTCILLLLTTVSSRFWHQDVLSLGYTGTPKRFEGQLINHFSPLDQRTFSQRYWVNDEVYKQGGPIFLYLCGEATCKGTPGNSSFVYDVAKKAGALLVAIEHRYYGETQPFGRDSMKLENMVYLTVENALEDIAYFMKWFKANSQYKITDDQRWITIGGSYPGALSAWFRSKYPHLTAGAWASSGVVNAILDFDTFDYQIYLATSKSGPDCPKAIQNLTAYFETQLYTTPSFKVRWGVDAQKLSNDELLWYIADSFALRVQYGGRVELCNIFKSASDFDDLVTKTIQALLNSNSVKPYGAYFVKNETLSNDNDDDTGRQWNYQVCTQVGWFQPPFHNNSEYAMRSSRVNMNFFKQFCKNVYGDHFWPDTNLFNGDFGGLNLHGTNIALLAGSEDPWTWACKNFTTGSQVSLYANCENCGHCVDMKGETATSPESLKELHHKLERLILSYVGNSEEGNASIYE